MAPTRVVQAPPLVTLLSSEPEIQYVALRNINLIVQKRPSILAHEIKVFFCKYNDPIYVKMEKLEIMIKLASDRNVDQACILDSRRRRVDGMPSSDVRRYSLTRHLVHTRFSWSSRNMQLRWMLNSCGAPSVRSGAAPSSLNALLSAVSM